jgi:rhomboid protease GluP
LKQQCLRLVEIKSVERLKNFNGVMAVIIGRYEKLSIILERSNFTSPAEFDDFLHFLEYAIANNRSARSSNEIRAVDAKSSVSTSLPLAILSLLMLGVYVLYTDASYENITTAAIELGGLDKKMLQTGELYRFASSFFLHYTPYHLGLNVISLAVIGRYVDVIAGRVRFVNILLISAVSGSLLSLAFSHFDAVVGASGGILGLFGAYLSIVARFHNQLPGSVSAPRRNILLVLALQFLCDFVLPGVDVFSHIGGFLAGFLYARITLNKCTVGSTALATRIEFTLAATISSAFIYGLFYFFTIAFGFHLHYS